MEAEIAGWEETRCIWGTLRTQSVYFNPLLFHS